jgi:hypothetical protein
MSYNRKLLKQMTEESKQKKTTPKYKVEGWLDNYAKKPIVNSNGYIDGEPPSGHNWRIPGNKITMDLPGMPSKILAVPSEGNSKVVNKGEKASFPKADYVDEYPMMKKGGEPTPLELAKIKAKMALESHFGNPAARRMTTPYPQSLVFKEQDGKIGRGTHYVYNQDNFVVPTIQEGSNGKLFYNQNASPYDREAIRFNSPEDAASFAQYYKNVAPMTKSFRKNGGDISIPNLEEGSWLDRYDKGGGPLPSVQKGKLQPIKPLPKRTDSDYENFFEIFDPTGISSWDDVYRSYKKSGLSSETALEVLGALPLFGNIAKVTKPGIHLAKYSKVDKALFNTLPKNKSLSRTFSSASKTGRGTDAYQTYEQHQNGGQINWLNKYK